MAEIKPDEVSAILRQQLSGYEKEIDIYDVGTVVQIGDGVAKIEGLARAKLNEMLDFGHGVTGLALNLEETEVGAIILGDYTQINEGDEVRATGKLLQVPVGKGLLGRVVNMLGQPIAESNALLIPTASYGHVGGVRGAYRFITGTATTPMAGSVPWGAAFPKARTAPLRAVTQ
jgi:F-type H+-transporting ATPase subunit alpha